MKYLIDTHTHSIMSGHAYNTIDEMSKAAAERQVECLAITEHAPEMPGSCKELYFHNLKVLPREKFGMKRLFGVELNIMDYNGTVDLPQYVLKQMDIVIASFHAPCIKPGTVEQNTQALLNVIKNPYINILGHPDDSRYPVDFETVILAAKENHTLLELNNTSLKPNGPRVKARNNDIKMLELCKKHNAYISLASDAHVEESICDFSLAIQLLQEVDFPDRLIVNTDYELLMSFLAR